MLGKLKKPLYWVSILLIAGVASVVGKEVGRQLAKPSDEDLLRSGLIEAAKRINSQVPKRIDDHVTLVRAESGPKNLTSTFQLSKLSELGSEADRSKARIAMIKDLCVKPLTRNVLSMGAKFEYVYLDHLGAEVYRTSIGIHDCP